jgi:hypothetical protein
VSVKKITATEIMKGPADRLGDERLTMHGRHIHICIKRVGYKDNRYWLYFMDSKYIRPQPLTASMVRTLEFAFGDDCNDWKGRRVMLVDYPTQLLVLEEHYTYDDDGPHERDAPQERPRKGKPVLSVVPRSSR